MNENISLDRTSSANLNVCIIGTNGIAHNHGDAIRKIENLNFSACCDIRDESRSAYASKYDITPYADYKRMISEKRPDIVIIATPDEYHCEQAVYCANHGCNLLIQKPFAVTLEDASLINRAVKTNSIKAKCCHNYRYTAKMQTAKRLIDDGRIGDVKYIRVSSPASPFWTKETWNQNNRKMDWLLIHNGMHQFDCIAWLTGSLPASVYASSHKGQKWLEVDEYVQVFIELSNGSIAESVENRIMQPGRYPFHQDLHIIGTKGSVDLSDISTHSMCMWNAEGLTFPGAHTSNVFQCDPFVEELLPLIRAITTNTEVDITLGHSTNILAAVLGAAESLATKSPVSIKGLP